MLRTKRSVNGWRQHHTQYLVDADGRQYQLALQCTEERDLELGHLDLEPTSRCLDFKLPRGKRFALPDPASGDVVLFAYPHDPSEPVARGLVREWWRVPADRATGICIIECWNWTATQWTDPFERTGRRSAR